MATTSHSKSLDNHPVTLEKRWLKWAADGLPVDIALSLELGHTHTRGAAQRVQELVESFDPLLAHYRPDRAVEHWLASAETWEDRLDRRAAIATWETLSEMRHTPLPWPGWQAPAGTATKRILRELELGLLRQRVLLYDDQRIATLGLLEAGATSGELPQVTPACVDGADVHLPGNHQHSARTVTIRRWAQESVRELAATAPADRPLTYTGGRDEPAKIQSSILMNLKKPFTQSGLLADKTLAPMSVNYTGLRMIFDEHGFEACVAAAGVRNWERLRRNIGLV